MSEEIKRGETLTGIWRKHFDFRFLSGEDLLKDFTVEIEEVTKEKSNAPKNKDEEIIVVWFKGAKKGMVCNKTNHKTIAKVVGSPMYEHWIGKKIVLYAAKVKAFGSDHTVVRVREKRVA